MITFSSVGGPSYITVSIVFPDLVSSFTLTLSNCPGNCEGAESFPCRIHKKACRLEADAITESRFNCVLSEKLAKAAPRLDPVATTMMLYVKVKQNPRCPQKWSPG